MRLILLETVKRAILIRQAAARPFAGGSAQGFIRTFSETSDIDFWHCFRQARKPLLIQAISNNSDRFVIITYCCLNDFALWMTAQTLHWFTLLQWWKTWLPAKNIDRIVRVTNATHRNNINTLKRLGISMVPSFPSPYAVNISGINTDCQVRGHELT